MSPTLLQQMEESATNHAIPVAALLRKALILSKRLRYPPLGEWAKHELEGYSRDAELPDYRAYRHCQVLGDFSGPMGSGMRNQPIPSGNVEDDDRHSLFGFELREGVPKYQTLIDSGGSGLSIPWDQNYVAKYQEDFYEAYALSSARRILGLGDLTQVLEGVRTRLLNFSLDIEETNPAAGEAESGTTPISPEKVSTAFHLHISGNNNIVTTAGRDLAQQLSLDDSRWEKLCESLVGLGVPDNRLSSLRDALQEDAAQQLPPGAMGPATAAWYERLSEAVKEGAVTLTTEVAAGAIAVEILKFIGAG